MLHFAHLSSIPRRSTCRGVFWSFQLSTGVYLGRSKTKRSGLSFEPPRGSRPKKASESLQPDGVPWAKMATVKVSVNRLTGQKMISGPYRSERGASQTDSCPFRSAQACRHLPPHLSIPSTFINLCKRKKPEPDPLSGPSSGFDY